jgi:16S rRNA (uracil1498-N3)-methyltransferase
MSRRRFYVEQASIHNDIAVLPPSQAHHLRNVLRLNSGDIVELFDDAGSGYIGEVELRGSEVHIRLQSNILPRKESAGIILAAALIKSAKFEWILQKATELGVSEIVPLKTRLSDIDIPDEKIDARLARWGSIVRESSKQCRRFHLPKINKPLLFRDFLASEEIIACHKCLFYEKSANFWRPDLISPCDKIVLCLGPEGGWDFAEVEQAEQSGFQICGLGPLTLRAETAAIAAIAILQHQIHLKNVPNSQPPDFHL